jgi:hypothetical protein
MQATAKSQHEALSAVRALPLSFRDARTGSRAFPNSISPPNVLSAGMTKESHYMRGQI